MQDDGRLLFGRSRDVRLDGDLHFCLYLIPTSLSQCTYA